MELFLEKREIKAEELSQVNGGSIYYILGAAAAWGITVELNDFRKGVIAGYKSTQ